jgi:hypothetical protein
MVINVIFDNNFVMNEIEDNNGNDNMDRFSKWTNLLCPSCAIYYGIQSVISGIKKKKRRSAIMQNK